MKKLLMLSLALTLTVGQAYGLGAPPPGVTGDRSFDATLQNLLVSATADPNAYYRELSATKGISEQELRQAKERYDLNYSDLYMASALAKATNRPVLGVAEEYHQNQGQGWGVMAQRLGIKPGSAEFKAMKSGARGSLDHMKAEAKNKQKHEQAMKKESEQKMKQGEANNQGGQGKGKQDQQGKKNSENKGQGTTK